MLQKPDIFSLHTTGEKELSASDYGVGISSFIPVIGIALGLAGITIGSIKLRMGGWKLILLSVCGITTGTLFCLFVFHGIFGNADRNAKISQRKLKQTIVAIEFYRQAHGKYPGALENLEEKVGNISSSETYLLDVSGSFKLVSSRQLHQYELLPDGKHYYLFDLGMDGLRGTADDIYPDVLSPEFISVGYLQKKWK